MFTCTGSSNSKEIEYHETITKLDSIEFNKMSIEDKKFILDSFIEGKYQYSTPSFRMNQEINKLIKMSVKYPETLLIKDFSGEFTKDSEAVTLLDKSVTNINYEKGTFDLFREFKADNKLNMQVRGSILLNVKINGSNFVIDNYDIN